MKADQSISLLLDELVSGQAGGQYLHENLDLMLTWLANPESESAAQFRSEYLKRNISVDILRGYVFFILQQKLFSNTTSQPHEVLGLSRASTADQAKARYRKLMRVFHPDKAVGNVENFNSIAEKINLAYQQFLKEKDKPAQVKIESAQSNSAVYRSADIKSDKVESQLIRKVRHSFGSVKQFQLLFFGAVASFCLFAIVLLYLQSADTQQLQSYSSRAKAQELETDVFETVSNELTSTLMNQTTGFEQSLTTNDSSNNKSQINEESAQFVEMKSVTDPDAGAISQAASLEPEDSLPNNGQLNQQQLLQLESTLKEEDASSSDDYQAQATLPNQSIAKNSGLSISKVANEKQANDITADSDPAGDRPVDQEVVTQETDLVEAVLNTESVHTEINPLPKVSEGALSEQTAMDVVEAQGIKSTTATIEPMPLNDQQPEFTDSAGNAIVEDVAVSDQVSDFIKTPENKTPLDQQQQTTVIAPVKEVEIASLKPVAVGRFPVANIFEKRFVRKFLIKYLESIEHGNVTQIKNYLSSNLIIDGVQNTRENYLKNTFTLINQTSKRQYHVHFVGDVLRLDSGVFRVTVLLNHTYTFKNNIVSKNSAQKMFDIKRYSDGSEIINISSV